MSYYSLETKKYILLFGDIIILYASLYLTLLLRYRTDPLDGHWGSHFWPFTAIFFLWLVIFYISNLYDLTTAINNAKFYSLTAKALFFAFLLGTTFFYLNPQLNIAPKRNLLIDIVVTAALFLVWRQLFNKTLKSYLPQNKVAIIGFNEQTKELIKYFNDNPHLGLKISFILSSQDIYEKGLYNVKHFKDISKIKECLSQENISTVILTDDVHASDEIRSSLFNCINLGINFVSLPHFYEKITGRVPVESINQMWFLENLHEGGKLWFDKLKRLYDIIMAFFILAVTGLFWLIIAAVIKIESRGPVFYRQERIGKGNKIIYLIKFRSMVEEGNSRRPTVPNDPRVTNFGRFLRKTRADEIPQVINIIKGEMSIIGPRPERPELAERLQAEIPFYNERSLVLPGISGWDQVCGEYHSPSKEDTIKKLQYDLYYIKNRSLFLDLVIILKTVRTVLLGREASNS
ncbi:sugar transferase [Candidatus Falkowbacteria bacterium CG10_big_fil_rev_8_21_14_0_10_43_10]|uniref:Sugar transferase n=1 Tax=Candidatus Falkowbacteria bacterium CG10_big_fil_rev_8_21_14_0_10_43_10 TaxID=1974567 RepID=A0A2H0V223_9BACT|nr:MAG: sugar transferase [Candidatus Falkowbacteria bacterium CG10_big_fil_rev_8_21_14_0_10_43_10]